MLLKPEVISRIIMYLSQHVFSLVSVNQLSFVPLFRSGGEGGYGGRSGGSYRDSYDSYGKYNDVA